MLKIFLNGIFNLTKLHTNRLETTSTILGTYKNKKNMNSFLLLFCIKCKETDIDCTPYRMDHTVESERFWRILKVLNPYPWILEKSKMRDHHRACFAKKNPERNIMLPVLNHLYMVLCFRIFFRKSRSVTVPKIGIYFYSNWHIFHHNGICYFKLTSQDSSTDTLSARIIFNFLVLTVTSQAIILDFFSRKRARWWSQKNHG